MKRLLPFSFYLVYFSGAVFLQPFVIVYFQELGFSGAQIGFLAAMTPLIFMLGAPLWTGLADATHRHKLIMSITVVVSAVIAGLFPLVNSFILVVPIVIVYALFAAAIIPFADSATMSMLGDEKAMYGRVRLGGTLGWGLFAPLAGLIIQGYGIRWAFWGFSIFLIFSLFIVHKFSFVQVPKRESFVRDIRLVLADQRWMLFLALSFVAGVGFAIVSSFLFPYMRELNISKATMEVSLTIATISELPVLFFANFLLMRIKARGLLVLAVLITGLRLLLYAILNYQTGILGFQLLNGMTYPMFWVAGVSYANAISPDGMKSTAQGLLGAMVSGFGAAAGGLMGGLLLGGVGGQGLFLYTGVFVLLSLLVIILLERRQRTAQFQDLA